MISARGAAAIAAALLGGATTGCQHDAPAPVTPTNATPLPPPEFTGDDLSLVPARADFVIGIDAAKLRASAVFTDYLGPQLAKVEQLAMIKSACGFDPVAAVTSATIAGVDDDHKDDLEMIVHGVPRARVLECLPKAITQLPAKTKVTQDHDTWVIDIGDGGVERLLAVRFVAANTAVVTVGSHTSQAGIDGLLKGAAPALPSSVAFNELHAKLHGTGTVWFVANLTKTSVMPGMTAAYGTVELTDGASLDVAMRFASADAAQSASSMLKSSAGQAAAFVSRFDVAQNDAEVTISAGLDHAKLTNVLGMMGGVPGMPAGNGPMPVPPAP